MTWFSYIAEALWIIVQCFITWRLLNTITEERFRHGTTMSVLIILTICMAFMEVYNVIVSKAIASSGTLTLYSLVFALASLILYKNRVVPKIQTCIIIWELGRLFDYFFQTILYGILNDDAINPRLFQILGMPRGILLVIYSLALFLFCKKICFIFKKYIYGSWLLRWPGLIFSVAFWWLLAILQRVYYSHEDLVNVGYLFLWQLFIFAVIIFILILWILRRRWKLQDELRLQHQRIEFMERKHEQLIKQYQERRQLVHDSKNNYLTLRHYIDKGDLSGAKQFIDELMPNKKETSIYKWSGHEILDMIFSIKVETAESADIKCKVFSDDLTGIKLTDVEISSLFSNLLDNAIEAQVDKESIIEKWIEVNVKKNQDTMYINVQNPFEGSIRFENGKPISSKNNKEEHGIGGLLIENIVKRYDGIIRIRTENHIFNISIIMNAF